MLSIWNYIKRPNAEVSPGTTTGLQSIEGGVLAEHRGAHHRVDMACLTVAGVHYGSPVKNNK